MERPFRVEFAGLARPGELSVGLTFGQAVDADREKSMAQVLLDFAALGASGALSGATVDPAVSSLVAEPLTLTREGANQVFRDVRIDPGALTCLLNMLEWASANVVPLSHVRLDWEDVSRSASPGELSFPGAWPRISFDLEVEDLDRRFLIDIRFSQSQPPALVDRVIEHLGDWFTAVNRGAYGSQTIRPQESCVLFGDDVVAASEAGLVWFIDDLRASDTALDGAVNALECIHRRIVPIRSVTLS